MSVPPSNITSIDLPGMIDSFTAWWDKATYGLFTPLLAGLFVFSVFLKTRSMSATVVAAVLAGSFVSGSWVLLVIGLGLAGILYAVWERSGA